MPAKLVVTPPGTGERYDFILEEEETRIGRAPLRNQLVLSDDRVSREHAILRRDGSTLTLIDLSTNGTFVNGQRVKECVLRNKDAIAIGSHTLVYEEHEGLPSIEYESHRMGSTVLLRKPDEVALDATLSGALGAPLADLSVRSLREDVEALRKKAETLSRLYELSRMLTSVFSLQDIFEKVAEMLFRTTPADRYVVLLRDPLSGELAPFASRLRGRSGALDNERITISKTVLDQVLSERVSLLSYDAQADARLGQAISIVMQRVHSVMCAPLLGKDAVLGVIYVDCQEQMKMFTADDLDMLNALAAQTSIAVDNAMTHDQLLKEALARAAYGRFMPKFVVDAILKDPTALNLGGTNQVVTTLFSDIRGFTTMSENLPPETVVKLLNEYFADMTPIVFDNQGLLDKYIGDGMMALFGVPYRGEGAAMNAVWAAIQMQRRMVSLNEELRLAGLPPIAIGIGINTGMVTVGYIGSEQRTDYTAIGDAVNLAARLEKQAGDWQILVSHSTLMATGDRFPVQMVGEIRVKGRQEPVQVYQVLWRETA